MRAGRLLQLVLILQDGRRHTAQQLAEELQVSGRTVLRDLDALSAASVPVYATRGPGGGFQLLDTFRRAVPTAALGLRASRGRLRRVRVRLAIQHAYNSRAPHLAGGHELSRIPLSAYSSDTTSVRQEGSDVVASR